MNLIDHRKIRTALCLVACTLGGLACGDSSTEPESEMPTSLSSLEVETDGVTLNGFLNMQTTTVDAEQVSIGLRWNIEDRSFPSVSTTTSVEGYDGGSTFSALTDVKPPAVAFEPSESNGQRQGFASAYLIAYVDVNENGALDCRNPGSCEDIFVGASPNTLVTYGDKSLTDTSPIYGFDGQPGIVPTEGWSLLSLEPNACEERPTVRLWKESTDDVEVVVIGDFIDKERCERRAVNPDVD